MPLPAPTREGRRSFVSLHLSAGAAIEDITDLVGHANTQTSTGFTACRVDTPIRRQRGV
jgi:hypothetical protein